MAVSDQEITGWLSKNAGADDKTIAAAMNQYGVTTDQMARATNMKVGDVQARYDAATGIVKRAQQPVMQSAATYTPTTRQVSKPTETAQGQMESILSKDSPLMERARTIAKQGMAQRGLVNSSMSQGAGVAAMIDRATPIASQDANIYSQVAADNMNAANTAGQFNTGEVNKFGLQGNEQAFTAGENAANRTFQTSERLGGQTFTAGENALQVKATKDLETARQTFSATQAQLDREQQNSITKLNNDLSNANLPRTFAGNLALATSNQVAAIAADPNLAPDAKGVAIQNAVDNANSTMQWGSTFYNTPLPTIAGPGGTASTVNSGGTYKAPASTKPAWQEYLDANPDVAKVYGYNEQGAKEHYANYGQREGRTAGVTDAFKATL
jgi:hypothetical protein